MLLGMHGKGELMSEAQRRAIVLVNRMNEVAHPDGPRHPGLRLLGTGQTEVMRALAALERRTRWSTQSLHPGPTFDPEDVAYMLEARCRARGVRVQLITPPRTVRLNPLLTSLSPQVRLGPALCRCIIIDGSTAVLAGPDTVDGDTTAWLVTAGELLWMAKALWSACLAESRPALPEGTPPPLNERQVEVARGVCLGRTDAAIARRLGISERTVARDVAAILEVTAAGSRAAAVLSMLGRGRQSR